MDDKNMQMAPTDLLDDIEILLEQADANSAKPVRQPTKKRMVWREYMGVLWILPAFAMLCVFCLWPTLTAFLNAFTDWDGTNPGNFIFLDNFIDLFQDKLFWRSLLNVVILTVVCMLLGNAASVILAELMYNLHSKLAPVYRFLFVLPAMIPSIVTMLLWERLILGSSSTSVMNQLLMAFGAKPSGWFTSGNTVTVFLSIILYNFPWMGGTSFLIYLAGLNGIDESVIEASRLDGVGTWRRVFVIDLPLLKGQLKYFLVMGIIGGLQNYTMQYAITKGAPGELIGDLYSGTMVPGYYIYNLLYDSSRPGPYGYACAMGVVMFVIIMIITVINNKLLKSEE
ncbi:MAG: sugar ABC transporter permease [Clostridia bacterium]|nr:sugar ABC transporter permease [Clostridia bacterium]